MPDLRVSHPKGIIMPALIRKELRELLLPVLIAVGCVGLVALVSLRYPPAGPARQWILMLWLFGMPLLALMLGAQAVAKERSHQTLEWQGRWPVSRAQWWAAKLLSYVTVLAVVYAVVGAVAYAIGSEALAHQGPPLPTFPPLVVLDAALALSLFCLGFLLSTIRRSPFEAFGVALLVMLLFGVGWLIAMTDLIPAWFGPRLGMSPDSLRPWATAAGAVVFGLVCLAAAAWGAFPVPVLSFGRRLWRVSAAAVVLTAVAIPLNLAGQRYLSPAEKPDFGAITDAALSPDGRLVAFRDDNGYLSHGEAPRLWVMGTDGSGLHCAAKGPVWQFRWLPDSRRLVCEWGSRYQYYHFLENPGERWWWLAAAAGHELRRLPVRDMPGVFVSPRSTYLAVGDRLIGLESGRDVAQLAMPVLASGGSALLWAWAEDESAIYLVRGSTMYDLGPTPPRRIDRLDIPSGKLTRNVFVPPPGTQLSAPPGQSRWVLLTRPHAELRTPGPDALGSYATTIASLGGSRSMTFPGLLLFRGGLSPGGRYAWLYDRHWVHIADLRTGKVIRRLGGPAVLDAVSASGPHFSPDGKWAAFFGRPAGVTKANRHYRHDCDWVHITSPDGSAPLRTIALRCTPDRNPHLGWTASDELLLSPGEDRLVKLSRDGRETILLQAATPGKWAPR
jgi:hypothetical protein